MMNDSMVEDKHDPSTLSIPFFNVSISGEKVSFVE